MSGKSSFLCDCTKRTLISDDTVSLEFIWPGQVPLAGQFFLIKPQRTSVFLGRPISIAGFKAGIIRFLISKRGKGSSELMELKSGEQALLTGPLGNFWPVEVYLSKPANPLAIVAGGIGIAPLLMLAQALTHGKNAAPPFDLYTGFKSGSFGLEKLKPRELIISTEDGSEGKKGRILDFFKPGGYSAVFACGPEPMLKTLANTCINAGISCYVSVERHMACGVGACMACKVKTTEGNLNCCVDGPIFKAGELCFDE